MSQVKTIVPTEVLQKINRIMLSQLEGQPAELQKALVPVIKSSGKAVRPWLFLNAALICGGNWEELLQLAAALEFLHLASLIHDDLIDHNSTRRGNDTIQLVLGEPTAILAGDFCFGQSLLLAATYGEKISGALGELVVNLTKGEFLQKQQQNNLNRSEEEYWQCIYYKTAFFFQQICMLAFWASNGSYILQKPLYNFGTLLGLVFQLKDDLLDFTAASPIGKDTFQDVRQGIYNLPVIHSLQNSSNPKALVDLIKTTPLDKKAVIRELENSGSFHYTIRRMEILIGKSVEYLQSISPGPARQNLEQLVYKIAKRNY